MPIFTVYLNKDTGYVDNITVRERNTKLDFIKEGKNILEAAKAVATLHVEPPIVLDALRINFAQDLVITNPNLSVERKIELLGVVSQFRPFDDVELEDFQPSEDGGVVGSDPAVYLAATGQEPKPIITVYVDP